MGLGQCRGMCTEPVLQRFQGFSKHTPGWRICGVCASCHHHAIMPGHVSVCQRIIPDVKQAVQATQTTQEVPEVK